MGFFFASRIFLLGLAGVLIPLVLHLERRRSARTIPFTMLRFLREVERKRMLNLRFMEILLLLIRMALFASIALALAGPTFAWDGGKPWWSVFLSGRAGGHETLILLDASKSMGARGRSGSPWDKAVQLIRETAQTGAADKGISVYPFSDGLDAPAEGLPPAPFIPENDRVLQGLSPNGSATRIPKALTEVARLSGGGLRGSDIVILTDLQASAWEGLDSLPQKDWEGARIRVLNTALETRENLWLDGLERPALPWVPGQEEVLRFHVRCSGPADPSLTPLAQGISPGQASASPLAQGISPVRTSAEVLLLKDGKALHSENIEIAPGEDLYREWTLIPPPEESFRATLRLEPQGDRSDATLDDNSLEFEVPMLRERKVLLIGPADGVSRSAVEIALAPGSESERTLVSEYVPDVASLPGNLQSYTFAVWFLDPERALSPEGPTALASYVGEGGSLLILPGGTSLSRSLVPRGTPTDESLPTETPTSAELEKSLEPFGLKIQGMDRFPSPARVSGIDSTHPIFRAIPELSAKTLGSLHVSASLRMEGFSRDLIRIAPPIENLPADERVLLGEKLYGDGKILVLTTGLDTAASDLVVCPFLVPLLDVIGKYLSLRQPVTPETVPARSRSESDLTPLSHSQMSRLENLEGGRIEFRNASTLAGGIPTERSGGSLSGLLLLLAIILALAELWLANSTL